MGHNVNSGFIFWLIVLVISILPVLLLTLSYVSSPGTLIITRRSRLRSRRMRLLEEDYNGMDSDKISWLPASNWEHNHVFGAESDGFRQVASQVSVTFGALLNSMPFWTDDHTLAGVIDCLNKISDQDIMLLKLSAYKFFEMDSCLDLVAGEIPNIKEHRLNALNISGKGQPKIFQIGFNKAGTRSLWSFLHGTGIASAHWEGGSLAKSMLENLKGGLRLLTGWEPLDGFTDMYHGIDCIPERDKRTRYRQFAGYRYFRELDQQYPRSLFILNVRDIEDWIASRALHPGNCFNRWIGIWPDVRWLWVLEWYLHVAGVLSYFGGLGDVKPLGDLLVFDIGADNATLLHHFLRTRPSTKKHPRLKLDSTTEIPALCRTGACPTPQERADAYKPPQ